MRATERLRNGPGLDDARACAHTLNCMRNSSRALLRRAARGRGMTASDRRGYAGSDVQVHQAGFSALQTRREDAAREVHVRRRAQGAGVVRGISDEFSRAPARRRFIPIHAFPVEGFRADPL